MPLLRDKNGFRQFFGYLEETGLDEPVREICRAHATTLHEIYSNAAGPSPHAARLEVWWTLASVYRKSSKEIANLFDRDYSSILYSFRRLSELAAERDVVLALDTVRPLAIGVAGKTFAGRVSRGRRLASALRAKTS